MKNKILVISVYPEDETFGCGGTILKHNSDGDEVYCSFILPDTFSSTQEKDSLDISIKEVNKFLNFKNIFKLCYSDNQEYSFLLIDLVDQLSKIFESVKPTIIYIPHFLESSKIERVIFNSIIEYSQSNNVQYIKKIIAYENRPNLATHISNKGKLFIPNLWIDIDTHLNKKIEIMKNFKNITLNQYTVDKEKQALSLSYARGSNVGLNAAESFMILREIS